MDDATTQPGMRQEGGGGENVGRGAERRQEGDEISRDRCLVRLRGYLEQLGAAWAEKKEATPVVGAAVMVGAETSSLCRIAYLATTWQCWN